MIKKKSVQFVDDLPTCHPNSEPIILRIHRTKEKEKRCSSSLHEIELEQWSLFGINIPNQMGMHRKLLSFITLEELNSFLLDCNQVMNENLPNQYYSWILFFLPLCLYFICLPGILLAKSNFLTFVLPIIMIGIGCLLLLLRNYFIMKSIKGKLSNYLEIQNGNTFQSRGCYW